MQETPAAESAAAAPQRPPSSCALEAGSSCATTTGSGSGSGSGLPTASGMASLPPPSWTPRPSPGSGAAARDVGFADDEEEAEEATAAASAAARSEAIFSPHGGTKRERRVLRQLADSEHYAGAAASTTGRVTTAGRLLLNERKRPHAGGSSQGSDGGLGSGVSGIDGVGSPYEPSPLAPAVANIRARHMKLRARPMPGVGDEDAFGLDAAGGVVGLGAQAHAPKASYVPSSVRAPAHVYIVVHAIDSAGLRSEESQALLAELARIPQVHLIASCSHRNASVLWDARKARALNWVWVEAATNASYAHESVDSIHELLGCLYESAVGTEGRSAQLVLGHLTKNAKDLFKLLVRHQLDNPRSAGLTFAELYQKARPLFIATSETSLRKHINEFTTHDLVRTRSGPGGSQVYWCHFPGETLQAILDGAS
jgi:hypothetical protein